MELEDLQIAIVQYDIKWMDYQKNLQKLDELLSNTPKQVDLIVLPEMFSTGFVMNPKDLDTNHQEVVMQWMKSMSKRINASVLGSIAYFENDTYYNRACMVYPDGQIQTYDKMKLFTPTGENRNYEAGTLPLIVKCKSWNICPRICYDLRFPEVSRNTSHYDLLIYIANWPEGRIHHWDALIRARAIENQCYTIGVNRVGEDGNHLHYVGHSQLVDSQGNVQFQGMEEEGVFYVTLNHKSQQAYRAQWPFLADQ